MNARSKKTLTIAEATARLEAACARAEHATSELRDKLWRWGIADTDADAIINDLRTRRFVDDTRFARAFANDKVKFGRWGRRKVEAALYRKRIAADIICKVLDDIDTDTYNDNLEHLLRRKAASISDPDTYNGRAKLIRFGLSNGYDMERVMDVVDRITAG